MEKLRYHQDKVLTGKVTIRRAVKKPKLLEPVSLLARYRDWITEADNRPNDSMHLAGSEWIDYVNQRFESEKDSYPMAAQHQEEFQRECAEYNA